MMIRMMMRRLFQLETDKRDLENRLDLADAEIDKLHEWKQQILEEKTELEVGAGSLFGLPCIGSLKAIPSYAGI